MTATWELILVSAGYVGAMALCAYSSRSAVIKEIYETRKGSRWLLPGPMSRYSFFRAMSITLALGGSTIATIGYALFVRGWLAK